MKHQQHPISKLLSEELPNSTLAKLTGGNQPIGSNSPYDLVTPSSLNKPYEGHQVDEVPD